MNKKILTLGILAALLAGGLSTTLGAGQASAAMLSRSKDFWEDLTSSYGSVQVYQAQLTEINGSSLTVTKNGITYTIDTNSHTIMYRDYFGVGNLSELNIGDLVNIRGSDQGNQTIQANFVRDTSIQEYKDTFDGYISQITSNGFVLTSDYRGSQTVTINGNTKLTDKNGNSITMSQLHPQDHVVLDGIWDHSLNQINMVDYVKDYSLSQ